MKWQTTIQHVLLSVIVTLGILGGNVWAQPDFFDDFSDGDPADGSPMLWSPIFVWDGTGYTLTPEGLVVAGAQLCNPDGTIPVYDDVAVTVEIRRHANDTGAEYASGFLFRYDANWGNGYWMEVRGPNRFLLGYSSGAILASATLPFDVDEQDLMIHMEAEGHQIKGWCWAVGQSMPEEPQISVVHTSASSGRIALHAWIVGGQSVFRSVEVRSLKIPAVDFNGDGLFDVTDLVTFIDTWGQDDPAADFWNDGTVDVKDLEMLMDYWGKDVNDPTLLAHWALDETEGIVAEDSTGQHAGIVHGEPIWRPEGGVIGGALELDGVDDCIETSLALNPSDGPFSVLAWVLGGAPGQVIVCQNNGANWLMVEDNGVLATDLSSPIGKDVLASPEPITDGNWHRVGLTWDGAARALYVDDVKVAEDTLGSLAGQDTTLYVGASGPAKRGRAATFFSGLIDEVRIYNRAVRP